jgi:hypothetical protein
LILSQALSAIFGERLSHKAFEWTHEGGAVLLLIGIGLHVILNWSWLRASLRPRKHS